MAHKLVFQMTVCMATCRELASDLKELDKLKHDYWTLEKSATPAALLLPWFPSKAKKAKEAATERLYMKLYDLVEKRRAAKVPTADTIDLLMAEGLDNGSIIEVRDLLEALGLEQLPFIQFSIGVIFAGVINTGNMGKNLRSFVLPHPNQTVNHISLLGSPLPLFQSGMER